MFRSTVLCSQLGYAQRGLEVGDDGEWEVGGIDDVVNVVAAVRRLGDGLLDRGDSGVVYGRAYAVVYQVVAAVAYWSVWLQCFRGCRSIKHSHLSQQLGICILERS